MIKKMLTLGTSQGLYRFCGLLIPSTLGLSILLLSYSLWAGLFLVPLDYQQGDAFRIIYVHVPCALFSLLLYSLVALCSAIYLIWRIKMADVVAYCVAPLGLLFTIGALLTGAIWGKPMWGAWWVWDARLTSELILMFLYLGYLGLYQAIPQKKSAAKLCAILALVGVVDVPIIHYSVYWWHTLHQGSTLSWRTPTIDSSMIFPLLSMITAFGLYSMAVLAIRIRTEILRREPQHEWVILTLNKMKRQEQCHV